jgi:hypothetical protein
VGPIYQFQQFVSSDEQLVIIRFRRSTSSVNQRPCRFSFLTSGAYLWVGWEIELKTGFTRCFSIWPLSGTFFVIYTFIIIYFFYFRLNDCSMLSQVFVNEIVYSIECKISYISLKNLKSLRIICLSIKNL